jgi:hypothetical protein
MVGYMNSLDGPQYELTRALVEDQSVEIGRYEKFAWPDYALGRDRPPPTRFACPGRIRSQVCRKNRGSACRLLGCRATRQHPGDHRCVASSVLRRGQGRDENRYQPFCATIAVRSARRQA